MDEFDTQPQSFVCPRIRTSAGRFSEHRGRHQRQQNLKVIAEVSFSRPNHASLLSVSESWLSLSEGFLSPLFFSCFPSSLIPDGHFSGHLLVTRGKQVKYLAPFTHCRSLRGFC